MEFLDWLDTFKGGIGGMHGLPICEYGTADEKFKKDFYKKAEAYKKEYLASKYAEETEEECDKEIDYILECNEDY